MSILTAIKNELSSAVEAIEKWISGTVEPDAEKALTAIEAVGQEWLKQFETDFGAKALQLAVAAVASIPEGSPIATVLTVGAVVLKQLTEAGIDTAEQDAETVALNAARTALNAASIPSVTALSTPNASTAATAASGATGTLSTAAPADASTSADPNAASTTTDPAQASSGAATASGTSDPTPGPGKDA